MPLIMEKIYTKASMDSSTDFSESYQPLLNDSSAYSSKQPPRFRRFQLGFNILTSIYILITLPLLVYQSLWRIPKPYCNLRSRSHLAQRHHSNKRIAPANNAIAYELHPLLFHEFDKRYFGKPDDIDTHWHNLLQPSNIRASKEDLMQAHAEFSDDLVELSEGGHPAVLATYHELHCLDGLRKNMHKDYSFPNMTQEQEAFNTYHQVHCIESLRRTLMCKADSSLYAGYWIAADGSWPSKELRSNSQQMCTNWEKLDKWARERMLPKGEYFVKPGPFDNRS